MIIGFGFGSPLMALLMLLATSFISYSLYKWYLARKQGQGYEDEEARREALRRYYREQRDRARQTMKEYDLTDEEIERRIDEELKKK